MRQPAQRAQDGRVRKTRSRLRDALVSLIHERSYDTIAVKEILARADIGRTAFYAHFRDKDALLDSGIDHVLQNAVPFRPPADAPVDRPLWFSLPVFEFIGQCRQHVHMHMEERGRTIVHQHLRKILVERITDDVRAVVSSARSVSQRLPVEVLAEYLVATFLLVLDWWLVNNRSLSPQQADDVFRALVTPTLAEQSRAT